MALGFPEPTHQRNYQTGYYGLPAPFSGMGFSNTQGIYDPGGEFDLDLYYSQPFNPAAIPSSMSAGTEPYVPPPYTGYIPLTQPDPYYTSATPLGPQNVPGNKPWEASDAQMMVGMMGSNMLPTRDQPRIMGDSGGSGGGMAKGAIQGAMIGSKFGSPWWGAAIGGGLGALGMFDTTTPPQIIPAQIKRGSRTAFPQVPPMASYYPGLLNA